MKKVYATLTLASAAAAALALAGTQRAPIVLETPQSPPRKRIGREHHRATTYTPKPPTTEADLERIRRAEMKRARKAARLASLPNHVKEMKR